jgi:hypothetical protein
MIAAGGLAGGFTVTSAYQNQVQADVTACVTYAKGDAPVFEAVVRIEPATGDVRLRVIGDPRGEFSPGLHPPLRSRTAR